MTFAKVPDNLHLVPQVRRVSPAARWSYVASWFYSSNALTDGFLPASSAALVDADERIVGELEAAGLWRTADGGWIVAGFLDAGNRTRAEVHELSASRREAGKKGGRPRKANSFPFAESRSASASASVDRFPEGEHEIGAEAERAELEAAAAAESNLKANCFSFANSIREAWEREIGTTIADGPTEALAAYVDRLSLDSVLAAIRETGLAGTDRPAYALAILDRQSAELTTPAPASGILDRIKAYHSREAAG